MTKRKVILIDDERLARVELKNLLSAFPFIEVIGEASNADEGIAMIQEQKADLIFLDIQMPEKSGFDMLEELTDIPPVIFITAFDEYAIKAFEFNALDYILKPVNPNRLKDAIDQVFAREKIKTLTPSSQVPYSDQLYLKDGDESYFVKVNEISLFSSFGNYVKVHFNQKSILVHRSLNQIETRLPKTHFFRANRYSIINIGHIQEVKKGIKSKLIFHLSGGAEIECSERKSILFRERWGI